MVHFVHSYNSELLKIVTSSSAQDSYSMLFSFSAWRRAEELFIFPSAGANVGVSSCSMPNLPRYRSLRRAVGSPRACFLPRGFWGKAPGRQQRTRLHLLGFWAEKQSESPRRKALTATHGAIQSFPRRGLNANHHRTLRGSKIILITNKGILITNKGTDAN